jgi:predicted lipid-binding transport protein (Tim44 family)
VSPVPRRRGGLRGGLLGGLLGGAALAGFDAGVTKPTPFGLGNLALVGVSGL